MRLAEILTIHGVQPRERLSVRALNPSLSETESHIRWPEVLIVDTSTMDHMREHIILPPPSPSPVPLTAPQNVDTAFHFLWLPIMDLTTACSDRSLPNTETKFAVSSTYAGHSANVCCHVSSSQALRWHNVVGSLPST